MMNSVQLKIGGMTCSACAKAIERAVGKLPSAKDVSVNYATEKLSVSYDEKKLAKIGRASCRVRV